jgi:hypothetical protein
VRKAGLEPGRGNPQRFLSSARFVQRRPLVSSRQRTYGGFSLQVIHACSPLSVGLAHCLAHFSHVVVSSFDEQSSVSRRA